MKFYVFHKKIYKINKFGYLCFFLNAEDVLLYVMFRRYFPIHFLDFCGILEIHVFKLPKGNLKITKNQENITWKLLKIYLICWQSSVNTKNTCLV